MKSILFVDDEPQVLDGMRRMLYPFRGEWRMTFAGSGAEALQSLESTPYDVLVTDMRMPDITGAELLSRVSQRYPQVVRIVLSGLCGRDETLASMVSAHQYLPKPCNAASLTDAVKRALNLRDLLADSSLKACISRLKSLPSLPASYLELAEAARDPEVPMQRLGAIVSKDLGMSAKVLHLANSALFGLGRRLLDPTQACVYLGVDTIRALVLSLSVFSQFKPAPGSRFSVAALQDHSLRVSALARRIAEFESFPKPQIAECFLAGLLHDVGKLVLAMNYPAEYDSCLAAAEENGTPIVAAEHHFFGVTHAEVGVYLLRLWGFPDPVTEAVALHHRPQAGTSVVVGPLAVVYVAETLEQHGQEAPLDMEYLSGLHVESRIPYWRSLCRPLPEIGGTE